MSTTSLIESLPECDRGGTPLCERALIGALLIDGGLRARTRGLRPEEFGDRALGKVFEMLMDIDGPVDLVIAVDEAEKRGLAQVTGHAWMVTYLAALLDLVPDVENVGDYAVRIKRAHVARQAERFRQGRMRGV